MGFQSAEGIQESVPVLLLAGRPCKESTAQGLLTFSLQGGKEARF